MNFWEFSLLLFLCKCKFVHLAHKRPQGSLFDELPLNGALTTTTRPLVRRSATGFSDFHNQNGIGVFISLPNFRGESETDKEANDNSQSIISSNENDDNGHSHSQEEIQPQDVIEITPPFRSRTSRTKSVTHSIVNENDSGFGQDFRIIEQRHQNKPKVSHNTRFLSQSHFHSTTPQSPSPPTPKRTQDQYRHHTTIAFQTIPITRQVTEFVRVPNIVHHITSTSPSGSNTAAAGQAIKQSQDYAETPFTIREHYLKKKQQHQHHQLTQVRNEAVEINNNDNNRLKGHLSFSSSFGLGNDNTPANRLRQTINNIPDPELFNLLNFITSNRTPVTPRVPPAAPLIIRSPGSLSSTINFDSSQVLKEIVREQRYQLTLNDLNSRLREEKRVTDRARSDYKGLFSKGALLLSALTLLPAVVNPITTTTTVAGASAAASLPSYLLPVISSAVG